MKKTSMINKIAILISMIAVLISSYTVLHNFMHGKNIWGSITTLCCAVALLSNIVIVEISRKSR